MNEKKCSLNLYKNDEDINIEMNLNQLDELISTLELIEKVCQFFWHVLIERNFLKRDFLFFFKETEANI